jgi:hypothetical protein
MLSSATLNGYRCLVDPPNLSNRAPALQQPSRVEYPISAHDVRAKIHESAARLLDKTNIQITQHAQFAEEHKKGGELPAFFVCPIAVTTAI